MTTWTNFIPIPDLCIGMKDMKVRGCDTDCQEYVHWMTYWIVLAVLTIAEEVTDILLGCWFPLYYEIKLVFLFWLISPISRYPNGSINYNYTFF